MIAEGIYDIVTESGSTYRVNFDERILFRKSSIPLRGIDITDNGRFRFTGLSKLEVGESIYATYTDGTWILSTPIVSIEKVEDEQT